MKKRFLFIIMISVLASVAFGQNQNSIIKTQAMEMAKALLKKDFPTLTKFMHPNIIQIAGGQQRMIERMDTINAVAKQFGAEIKRIMIGNPGPIVKYKKELQVVLPQTTEMKTSFGNLAVETSLIAISTDGGKNWYFIDTSVYKLQDVKKAMPNLSPDLVVPPAKPPKFTPNQ